MDDGPFKVLECIYNSAYKIYLQVKYCVSFTFNVADLILYCADSSDLRSNILKEEKMM